MYDTSDNYKAKIYNTPHSLKVFINDSEIDKKYILSCKVEQQLFSNDEFSLGSITAKSAELKLYKTAVPETINKVEIKSGIIGEIIPVGIFNVDDISKDDDYTITLKLLDNMIKFEFNYDGSKLTYPATLLTVLQDICSKAGVNFGSTSFLNCNKEIAVYDNTVSARTYVSYIAESAGGFAYIGRDGKLYIKTIGETTATLPIKYFQKFKWGEKIKITRVSYEDGIQSFKNGDTTGNTIHISQDNMFIVDQQQIDNIYNQINGLEVYSFEGDSIIDPAWDIGDLLIIDNKKVIFQGSADFGGKWKASINSKIQCKAKEETMVKTPSQAKINRRFESKINQAEGKITQLTNQTTEHETKLSQQEQDIESIKSQVENTAEYKREKSGFTEIHIEDAGQADILKLEIQGNKTYEANLFPRATLYPRVGLQPNQKGG